MLGRFAEYRRQGRGLHSDELQRMEPMLTDALVQEFIGELCGIGLLNRAESGEWLLSRDLTDASLADLYEASGLRVRVPEAHLPCRDDTLGVAASAALDQLRMPLRELLKRKVSTIYDEISP